MQIVQVSLRQYFNSVCRAEQQAQCRPGCCGLVGLIRGYFSLISPKRKPASRLISRDLSWCIDASSCRRLQR